MHWFSRPQTLNLHSSWNALPQVTPPSSTTTNNSLKVEDETSSSSGKFFKKNKKTTPNSTAASKHPLRNLYVGNAAHSMDCAPTISVEQCSDNENSPTRQNYLSKRAKRHSSTGDALEMYRGNLQIQKRLRDLEANSSSTSLEVCKSAQITDFWWESSLISNPFLDNITAGSENRNDLKISMRHSEC